MIFRGGRLVAKPRGAEGSLFVVAFAPRARAPLRSALVAHSSSRPRSRRRFNGGPGCSSFDGSLMEVGPLRLVPGAGGELEEVEGAWNEYANLLFSQSRHSALVLRPGSRAPSASVAKG